MNSVRRFLAIVMIVICSAMPAASQGPGHGGGDLDKPGILLLAHGGSTSWNNEVLRLAAKINKRTPTEVAFGMASKHAMQEAAERLVRRGVNRIVAVPLFVSSHSTVITATQYLLGIRAQAPRELAIYARMDHNHDGHAVDTPQALDLDPMLPVKIAVPKAMAAALDRHPIVAEILRSRARAISKQPEHEVVIVVAHGPVSDEENLEWLADMGALADRMKSQTRFKRIEYLTVRDDASEPVRAAATAELRTRVAHANSDGNHVLIVPLLLSYGGIEQGIRERLDGLTYTMAKQALLPNDRLLEWVLWSASAKSPQNLK